MQWADEIIPVESLYSWHYWRSSIANMFDNVYIMGDYVGLCNIYKNSPKIAYFAFLKSSNNDFYPILLSPDRDAVSFNFRYRYVDHIDEHGYVYYSTYLGDDNNAWFSLTDSRGITWYGSGLNGCAFSPTDIQTVLNADLNEFLLKDEPYEGNTEEDAIELAQYMVKRIYAIHFHEAYQVGHTYNTYSWTNTNNNMFDVVMKVIGLWLLLNIHLYDNSVLDPYNYYKYFSDRCLSISYIRYFLSDPMGKHCIFYITNYISTSSTSKYLAGIYITGGHSDVVPQTKITNYHIKNRFLYYDLYSKYPDTSITFNVRTMELYMRDGYIHITPGSGTYTTFEHYIGLYSLHEDEYPWIVHMIMRNIDIELKKRK